MREIETAKKIDLPAIWPGRVFRVNARMTSNFCPSCGEGGRRDRVSISSATGIWRWHCFACGSSGTAIDMLMAVERIGMDEAVKRLIGNPGLSPPVPQGAGVPKHDAEAFRQTIRRIRQYGLDQRVLGALGKRGISARAAQLAYDSGLLVTLPGDPNEAFVWLSHQVGRERLEAAGLWKKRWPPAAYRPLIFTTPDDEAAEFRTLLNVDGCPKSIRGGASPWPLVYTTGNVERIMVVEGGIDLLSALDIFEDVESVLILGLLGTGSWKESWAKAISRKYPGAAWQIGTDNDQEGERCAARIAVALDQLGIAHRRVIPACGKDWNEYLQFLAA